MNKLEMRPFMTDAEKLEVLSRRIQKAQEILETILSLGDWEAVKSALDALEGK